MRSLEKGRGASVMDHFQDLEDPRIERSKRHGLLDILTIAIWSAVICGADSWVYVEMFGKSKEEWFRSFGIPAQWHSVPRHVFGDVFSRLDPDQFQEWLYGMEAKRWRICCPERWWPLMARQCAAPTTKGRASRPSIWSVLPAAATP